MADSVSSVTGASIEARYSRQIYAVGAGAMRRLLSSRIAVVGLGSVGAETAKNVLLSGCPSVALFDATPVVHPLHTESNYFIPRGTAAAGTARAAAVHAALAPLNPTASVTVLPADSSASGGAVATLVTRDFGATVVVLADPLGMAGWTPATIADFASGVRAAGVPIVVAETYGVFCRVFNDFGDRFTVEDPVGEDPAIFPVVSLENAAAAARVVVDVADHMLPIVAGDRAVLSCGAADVVGAVTARTGSDTLEVAAETGHESEFAAWLAAATASGAPRVTLKELRSSLDVNHRPWAEVLGVSTRAVPPPEEPVVMSMTRDVAQSAALFAAMHEGATDSSDAFLAAATRLNGGQAVDETATRELYRTRQADLVGMAAFVGGVASQEALKAATARLVPITQCWYCDFREIIVAPVAADESPAHQKLAEASPSHAAIFGGGAAVERLRNSDVFVVGAGAIGCEYLKNLALVGVGLGAKGRITVTDMDSIEVSNLSRQFLFREPHVGQNKAATAAAAIKAVFGPKLKIRALQEKVAADTAHPATGVFNKRFWAQCSVICTAVDNVAAREFLDECAAAHKKPMVDSGTQAARGHVEVFAPFATGRFKDAAAPTDAGKAVPFCTLHFFPTTIDHCIQFATDLFAGRFTTPPENANRCAADFATAEEFAASLDRGVRLNTLRAVHGTLCDDVPSTWADAVAWARSQFDITFVFPPKQLLLSYPLDKTDADGKPYWTGAKRPPTVPTFDLSNAHHREFLLHAAAIYCRVHGVPVPSPLSTITDAELQAAVDAATLPELVPQRVVAEENATPAASSPTDAAQDAAAAERRAAEEAAEQAALVTRIDAAVEKRRTSGSRLAPEVFEKDDEANSHVEFVAAVANIRAASYGIAAATNMEVKRIAGRIVPAMITTTAVVTGLATLQACRLLAVGAEKHPNDPAETWRAALTGCANTAVNLSDMAFTQSFEASPPTRLPFFVDNAAGSTTGRAVAQSPTFTTWEELSLPHGTAAKDVTIAEAIAAVAARYHGLRVIQIVEASKNAWVYDASSGADARHVDFPLVGWTQRLLGLTDDDVAALGRLAFILRCEPPEAVRQACPNAVVNEHLPPLVVPV